MFKVLQSDSPISEKQVNELSEEGWRLVTSVQVDGLIYWYLEHVSERAN